MNYFTYLPPIMYDMAKKLGYDMTRYKKTNRIPVRKGGK